MCPQQSADDFNHLKAETRVAIIKKNKKKNSAEHGCAEVSWLYWDTEAQERSDIQWSSSRENISFIISRMLGIAISRR